MENGVYHLTLVTGSGHCGGCMEPKLFRIPLRSDPSIVEPFTSVPWLLLMEADGGWSQYQPRAWTCLGANERALGDHLQERLASLPCGESYPQPPTISFRQQASSGPDPCPHDGSAPALVRLHAPSAFGAVAGPSAALGLAEQSCVENSPVDRPVCGWHGAGLAWGWRRPPWLPGFVHLKDQVDRTASRP